MRDKEKSIWTALFVLFMVALPFGPALPNILFGIIMVFWLYQLIKGNLTLPAGTMGPFLLINGYVLFHVFSLLWSENLTHGLDKSATLLMLPAFYLVHASVKKHIGMPEAGFMLGAFSISLFVLVILSFAMAFFTGGLAQESLTQQALSTAVVNFHYLGFSLYLGVAVVLNLYFLLFHPGSLPKNYERIGPYLIVLFSVTLVLLSSRTTLVVTGIIALGQLTAGYKILLKPGRVRNMTLVLLLLVVAAAASNRVLRDKVKEAVNLENRYDVREHWGGRGFRELIWNCASHVFWENPLVGVGYGDQKAELDLCYRKYRYEALLFNQNNFNAHNVFLQVLVATGAAGLILFLLAFAYPVRVTLKRGHGVYLVFVLMFLGTGLTESHFNRNAMVSLFAFLNPLIWFVCTRDESPTNT